MSPRKIKNLAISYIAEQLEKNPNWFFQITDSWIYDAENWFLEILEKRGMKIFTNDTDFEYTEEVEIVVRRFWGFVQKEKERRYNELYGERDAYLALSGMIKHIKKVKDSFESSKDYYIQDSHIRKGKCTNIIDELNHAMELMKELKNKQF